MRQDEEGHLKVRAFSADPVPGKDCQRHGEGGETAGRQPSNEVQQLGLHAAATGLN